MQNLTDKVKTNLVSTIRHQLFGLKLVFYSSIVKMTDLYQANLGSTPVGTHMRHCPTWKPSTYLGRHI